MSAPLSRSTPAAQSATPQASASAQSSASSQSSALTRVDLGLLVLLTAIWGFNWPIMKLGVLEVPPLTFRAGTLVGGVAFVGLLAKLQGHSLQLPRAHWRETAVLGFTNLTLWYILSMLGISLLASGRAAILGYTLPVWVALIGAVFYHERHGGRLVVALVAASIGVALLLVHELQSLAGAPLGTALMLGAAASWGLGTHQMRRRRQQTPLLVLTFWMMVGALIVSAALALAFDPPRWQRWPSASGWFSIVFNIVLAYGVAQLVWLRLATRLPPMVAALSVMMIPVVGVLAGQWLLGERPVATDYAALVAILVAIGATLLPSSRRSGG